MNKYKWFIIIILAIIITGVAIWFWKFRAVEQIIQLETAKVEYGSVGNFVTAIGTLHPVDTVAVGAQISGTIKTVFVDFNTTVKKGQLLAQLDKSLMEAQVQQYNATLQQARANEFYQKSNHDRQHQLYDNQLISKAEIETADFLYQSARQNVNSILAQLKTAQKNLSFTNIYSPINGIVLARSVSEGQTVAASLSTPTLFSIAKDLTKMQVQGSVDEADIGNVKKGQRVSFSVDAFPLDTFAGTVKEIRLRSSVSANVVTYITIIDAPNSNMKLKPGMTANITIYTQEVEHTLRIPSAALRFRPDSLLIEKYHLSKTNPPKKKNPSPKDSVTHSFVWIKKDSVTIQEIPILTGLDDQSVVQVVEGLGEGNEIIIGYKKAQANEAKTNQTTKSPFLPTRGGNNRSKQAGPPN